MKKFFLLAISVFFFSCSYAQIDKRKMMFMLMNSSISDVNPNIALGNALLTTNAKTRAYWDFTQIVGDDWDILTSHPDISVNGTYNLINNSGAFSPSLGFFNVGEKVISTIRARTTSGVNNAFITSQVATALSNGAREFHYLFTLQDGRQPDGNRLAGILANNGVTLITRIDSSGKILFNFGYGGNTCTYLSDNSVISDNVTDIHLLRIRMTTTSVTMMLDGVVIPCSLSAGVAISTITLSGFSTPLTYGVGGVIGNANNNTIFRTDGSIPYKYIIKHAVTDLLTDEEYLQLVASFNDFTSVY